MNRSKLGLAVKMLVGMFFFVAVFEGFFLLKGDDVSASLLEHKNMIMLSVLIFPITYIVYVFSVFMGEVKMFRQETTRIIREQKEQVALSSNK